MNRSTGSSRTKRYLIAGCIAFVAIASAFGFALGFVIATRDGTVRDAVVSARYDIMALFDAPPDHQTASAPSLSQAFDDPMIPKGRIFDHVGLEERRILSLADWDSDAFREYFWFPSIAAQRDVFLAARSPEPTGTTPIAQTIAGRLGIERWALEPGRESKRGDHTYVELAGSEGGLVQAITATPRTSNGKVLIALHGCSGSPDTVMDIAGAGRSQSNGFGEAALEAGYTVYAPYILNVCDWTGQFDDIGINSDRTALGYAISQTLSLADFIEKRHPDLELSVWGLSYGAQVATFVPHFAPVDTVVLSGSMVHDYEAAKLLYFESYGLSDDYRTARSLIIDREIDRFAALAKTDVQTLIVEMGTADQRTDMIDTVRSLRALFEADPMRRFAAVTFDGGHATCPSCVLQTLEDLSQDRTESILTTADPRRITRAPG